jgi:tetratricopeptide (TPR) repeat protein
LNLTQIAYADQVGMPMTAAAPVYRPGRKYKWVAERELMYAAAKDFSRQVSANRAAKGLPRAVIGAAVHTLGDLRSALRGEKMFSTLRLRDPRPGIRMCGGLLHEALRLVRAPMKSLVTLQIIASVLSSFPASPAWAQQGPYDLQMLSILPAYCRNAQGYRERVPGADNAADIERWNKLMGQSNFHHIHHYCIGLANTHRALYRPLTRRERSWELEVSVKEFDYVISRATPDFVLLPEILTKRGENLVRLGRAPEAISTLMRAIDTKPDYWPPYAALSDCFRDAGQFEEARAWLEKGLAASPGAEALQRRSRELSHAAR